MGLQPKQWEDVLGRDRAELKAGNQRRDNLIQIIERGRNDGRLALAKTAFEMAVKDKDSKVLLHLLKTRLKLVEEQQVNLKGRVVFETQIGDDGVIRSSETPDDEEEGETWGT